MTGWPDAPGYTSDLATLAWQTGCSPAAIDADIGRAVEVWSQTGMFVSRDLVAHTLSWFNESAIWSAVQTLEIVEHIVAAPVSQGNRKARRNQKRETQG